MFVAVALLTWRRTKTRRTWREKGTNPRVCTVYSYAACSGLARALVPRKKARETVRNRSFVRFINTFAPWRNNGFVSAPRKKLENSTRRSFCPVYSYGAP